MNLQKNKKTLLMLGFLVVGTSPLFSQGNVANGPNAPAVGSIVPDEIIFGYATTPVADFGNQISSLPALNYVSYSDFPNEVVITVYHTPW